jgi:recombination protein RecA
MFGDKYTTSGGKALQFHASVRLRLKSIGKIKKKSSIGDSIVGVQTRAIVIKNRMGPPQREADFEIYFDRGIDDYASWLKAMKNHNLISQAGAWYTYTETDENGEIIKDHKFQAKDFVDFLESNPEVRQKIYDNICDETIMRYRSHELDIDNTEIEATDE